MASLPIMPVAETLEQRIARLLTTWRQQTAFESSSTKLTEHPAYQELIALGTEGLPFLFRDLELTADGHLSKALTALTGARPVPPEDRGNIRKLAHAWLDWARENGYRW